MPSPLQLTGFALPHITVTPEPHQVPNLIIIISVFLLIYALRALRNRKAQADLMRSIAEHAKAVQEFRLSDYPRTYRPRSPVELFVMTVVTVVYVVIYAFLKSSINSNPPILLIVLFAVLFLVIICSSVIQSVGYRVKLMPDMIEVTTLLGTKRMRRGQIASYAYGRGRGDAWINLHSTIPSLKDLTIQISFTRDREFNNWFKSLVGNPPLPEDNNDSFISLKDQETTRIRSGDWLLILLCSGLLPFLVVYHGSFNGGVAVFVVFSFLSLLLIVLALVIGKYSNGLIGTLLSKLIITLVILFFVMFYLLESVHIHHH